VSVDRSSVETGAAVLWRAEAKLRYDRRGWLAALERCFESGRAPSGLEGALDGRLVAVTIAPVVDQLMEAWSRVYLPWSGKTFDASTSAGRNRFARSARPWFRVFWPSYRDLVPDGTGGFTAFRFETSVGPSETTSAPEVLRLDYRHPESPWPVRLVLDEVVDVGEGQHLGQALVRSRGRFRRAAWFALEHSGLSGPQTGQERVDLAE
jgi:hypothetical protein